MSAPCARARRGTSARSPNRLVALLVPSDIDSASSALERASMWNTYSISARAIPGQEGPSWGSRTPGGFYVPFCSSLPQASTIRKNVLLFGHLEAAHSHKRLLTLGLVGRSKHSEVPNGLSIREPDRPSRPDARFRPRLFLRLLLLLLCLTRRTRRIGGSLASRAHSLPAGCTLCRRSLMR